jgi:hypothetical protein
VPALGHTSARRLFSHGPESKGEQLLSPVRMLCIFKQYRYVLSSVGDP